VSLMHTFSIDRIARFDIASFCIRLGMSALAAVALLWLAPSAADATKIERLITPGGIEVWLVRDPTVPLVAVNFGFSGGSTQDPPDKGGTANMMVDLLDEGAGDIDGKTFHELLERKAIELSFSAGRDTIRGTLRTLKENQDEAFELLRLAMTAPRFETAAVERIRSQIVARLLRASTNPNEISSRTWSETAYPNHPYGRPSNGTPESVGRITVDDMKDQLRRVFARDTLKIGMVGDIDPATAGRLIDRAFGSLPAKAELQQFPEVKPQGIGRRIVVDLDVPQAVVTFGGPGIKRSDPDFMAAYIVNHILGGGSFSSRLYREVREKRGLAYGVSTGVSWSHHSAVIMGGTATRNDATRDTLEVIENEIKAMIEEGPTEEEFNKAKTFLKGSFALGLDTSSKIANQLVNMQQDNLGIDYIDRRSALIDAVTLDDTRRVAKRLLGGGQLVTIVGRPEGVTSKRDGD
jgi:zinc protease